MSSAEVVCGQCGMTARLVILEGEVFPRQRTERPMLFQVFECPNCGRVERPDDHDGYGGAIEKAK